jgi:hypothetical protein
MTSPYHDQVNLKIPTIGNDYQIRLSIKHLASSEISLLQKVTSYNKFTLYLSEWLQKWFKEIYFEML